MMNSTALCSLAVYLLFFTKCLHPPQLCQCIESRVITQTRIFRGCIAWIIPINTVFQEISRTLPPHFPWMYHYKSSCAHHVPYGPCGCSNTYFTISLLACRCARKNVNTMTEADYLFLQLNIKGYTVELSPTYIDEAVSFEGSSNSNGYTAYQFIKA